MIKIKRVYEVPEKGDGLRVLVDRLWPRGISKDKARIDLWLKDVAPSDGLRKWFAHDPKKWAEFQKKFRVELKQRKAQIQQLKKLEEECGTLTLVYSARDAQHNQAVALLLFLKDGP